MPYYKPKKMSFKPTKPRIYTTANKKGAVDHGFFGHMRPGVYKARPIKTKGGDMC